MPPRTSLEERLLAEVSAERLMRHARTIARWARVSGTPDERQAVDYFEAELRACGLAPSRYEFESLLGWPEAASLEVVGAGARTIPAISHALVPSTPVDGLAAELVPLGEGADADYARRPVAGKIVLLDGMPAPARVLRAQERGVAGAIFANVRLHDMCLSPVWGTPTTRTAGLLPQIPVISILRGDAEPLAARAERETVTVRMRAETFLGWRKTPLLTADIPGAVEPERFVLFSGHHCSWYYGAMDNGAANATMLEVARILAAHRPELRRTVRLAFWPGHTQGRYSGSTWYCDHFWEDLHDHCVLHVNVDSTGAKGATVWEATGMPEARELAVDAIRDAVGFDPDWERQSRAGDQSFWGCGVSSIFMDLSRVPPELAASRGTSLFTAAGEAAPKRHPGGAPWWWHTPDDTIDKIDPEVLRQDTRVYALANLRAATEPILPLRFGETAGAIRATLERYHAEARGHFDLGGAIERARQVDEAARRLDALLERARRLDEGTVERVAAVANPGLMAIGRALVPTYFSAVEPFEQDLAIPIPAVAAVEGARRLAELDPASDAYHFLATEATRGRNRVMHQLREALTSARQAAAAVRDLVGGA